MLVVAPRRVIVVSDKHASLLAEKKALIVNLGKLALLARVFRFFRSEITTSKSRFCEGKIPGAMRALYQIPFAALLWEIPAVPASVFVS